MRIYLKHTVTGRIENVLEVPDDAPLELLDRLTPTGLERVTSVPRGVGIGHTDDGAGGWVAPVPEVRDVVATLRWVGDVLEVRDPDDSSVWHEVFRR